MKQNNGSITLFSLSFLIFFFLWFTFVLETHHNIYKTHQNIEKIHHRLETENAIFNMVRSGIKKGLYYKRAHFEVHENHLKIIHEGNSLSIREYDIIEDGSFKMEE
ncbi:hypothetical protein ERUR111494_00725 [Erysipelothrix urinaevulpis]|uniref:hypothetical protein n=1 Tax=Erysipelothrix urinaevulpis TaxID=2683717 RepID=UPI00135C94F4|nr:hypothetical protein [Erysipelothrix urinaevulpis]